MTRTAAFQAKEESSAGADGLLSQLTHAGFAFVAGSEMRPLLGSLDQLTDWPLFVDSWNDLQLDTYLPDGHRYRWRRHATLSARTGETHAQLQPHQPHYQSVDYNRLAGGIERWFEPIRADVIGGAPMQQVLAFCCRLFGALATSRAGWKIECHQFRIEARADARGQPTPEGMHRDGVDYVLVLLINRTNIRSGTTSVHDLRGNLLGSFTLTAPLDAALVDDSRVKHGVTAVEPIDPALPAYRDVLVVTFKAR